MAIRHIDLNPGELIHWKYIKREKLSNGKYRYYYDESELKNSRNRIDKYKTLGLRASAKAADAIVNNGKSDPDVKTYTDISEHYHALAERETKKYNMKKITSLPARAISKGAVAVANFFEKAKKAKKKNEPVVTTSSRRMYDNSKVL